MRSAADKNRGFSFAIGTLSRREALVPFIFLLTIASIHAEESVCRPIDEIYSHQIGTLSLSVDYEPLVILPGQNFKLNVKVEFKPDKPLGQPEFISIQAVSFNKSSLIRPLKDLEPKNEPKSDILMTRNTYIFEVLTDAYPGDYYVLVRLSYQNKHILEEHLCIPVGSDSPDYLEVIQEDTHILTWGDSKTIVIDLLNNYPYPYTITKVEIIPHENAPFRLETTVKPPLEIKKRNSSLKARLSAKYTLNEFLSTSNEPLSAELRLTYKDSYEREVPEKPVIIKFILVPPSYLLWLSALLGGLMGGLLRYWAGKRSTKISRELLFGVFGALVLYVIFQLGDISLLMSNLRITLDNNTVPIALFLGLFGGWRGKGVIEKIV
jgi:hypothetical protein